MKVINRKPLEVGISMLIYWLGIKFLVNHAFHLRFLEWMWPTLSGGKVLTWMYGLGPVCHFWWIFGFGLWLMLIVFGSSRIRERAKLKRHFESIGLTNGLGTTPTLSYRQRVDEFRERLVFHANGIGLNRFEGKKQDLESVLRERIESIKCGKNPSIVEITTTRKTLSVYMAYQYVEQQKHLPQESFFVGSSMCGIVTAQIQDLPHLLIAGATGGGKSVFFKQTIAGLLSSSPHLQIYLIDLKRGLEAKDFAKVPTVAIAKDIGEAVQILRAIHKEMDQRFKFLEGKGYKSIDPTRDGVDRIVVAVDEASELYAEKSKSDDDYELAKEAQQITNSIAKLGRAASVHLILATQKVQKETINTAIQENISARMCFKMNTLQGSLQVLGSKDALELPSISGRGIWQHGTEQFEVQVPFIDERDISRISNQVRFDIDEKKFEPLQSMLAGPIANGGIKTKSDAQNNLVDLNA